MNKSYKIPESVLVVVYTPNLDVLLIERAGQAGFWQSVTGSLDHVEEPLLATCQREVWEETGIDAQALGLGFDHWALTNVYDIYPSYLHRYAPGITRNTEHVFGLALPGRLPIELHPREHTAYQWLPWHAAADACFSPSNAEAISLLPRLARKLPQSPP